MERFKAFDKLHKVVMDVSIINFESRTCFLKKKDSRDTIVRNFEDVVLLRSTGCYDINKNELIEEDTISSVLTDIKMTIKYGEYEAYCPADRAYMKNIGFYVQAEGIPDMPLGPTEDYAIRIGNKYAELNKYN